MQYPRALFKSDYAAGLYLSMNQSRIQASLQSGSGFPDLMVFYPSRGYHGLFIEIKSGTTRVYNTIGPRKGLLSSNPHIQAQAFILNELNKLGYFARFGVGFDKCKEIIDWYMNPNYKKFEKLSLFDEPSS